MMQTTHRFSCYDRRAWILASRPKTLTAAAVPILVGTALAYGRNGNARILLSVFAFLSAILIQIGTNLVNDAKDYEKGADTEERLGPVRVTQKGLLTPKQVLWGGFFCFFFSILFGIPLVWAGGWPIVVTGIVSLLAGYAYTAGPFPLAYLGLGDLFVLIFFGWVSVGGVYYLNTGSIDWQVGLAGFQIGLLATVLIAINNFRDYQTDQKAQKKTLPVRFGAGFARVEILSLCLIPFLMGGYWHRVGMFWASVLPVFILPVAITLVRKILFTEPGVTYNRFLAQGAFLHFGFGVLLSIGFLIP